ncbi:MAG: hypothetical protein R8K53_07370 [Mariprofundaceae bacterium]
MTRLGIVAALCTEARCLDVHSFDAGEICNIDETLSLYICGMGEAHAAQASQALVDAGVDALLSWGFAGALDSQLNAGDLLLPSQILDRDGKHLNVDPAWQDRLHKRFSAHLNIHTGNLIGSDRIVGNDEQRREFRQIYDAIAIDMESSAIAVVATRAGIPFVAIRAVSDMYGTVIPNIAMRAIDSYGRLQLDGILHILGQPQCWFAMWQLGFNARMAKRTLKKAFKLADPGLCAWS